MRDGKRDGVKRSAWRSFGNQTIRAHLIWAVLATTAAMLLLASTVVLVPLFLRFDATPASAQELAKLTDRILALHDTLWPFIGLCIVAVFLSSWLILHRMVSPLVRYVRTFEAVHDGVLPAVVKLRTTDYLTEETEALNEMLTALRERHSALHASAGGLRAEIEELGAWTATHGNAELAALVTRMQDREKELADHLARVSLG